MLKDTKRPFIILVNIPLLLSFTVLAFPPNPMYELAYFAPPTGLYSYVCIGYGIYAIRHRDDKYFRKKSPENLIGQHEFIKKVVYVAIFPFILIVIILLAIYLAPQLFVPFISLSGLMSLAMLLNVLVGSLVGGLIWLLAQSSKKKFGYYFAKAYFQIGTKEEDRHFHFHNPTYETSKGVVISPDRECPKIFFEKITFNSIVDGAFIFFYLL